MSSDETDLLPDFSDIPQPKLAYWDTEWSPAVSYTWSPFPNYLSNEFLVEDPRLLCFGFKFEGEDTIVVDERIGHREMTQQLWDLLDQTDMLVSFNGQKFDTRKVNSEFMKYGMGPPSPYKQIDLFREIKRNAQFYSSKLDFLAERITKDRKEETGGFKLWRDVMAGDEAAWGKMRKYQKQDVDLLVDLFLEVRAWVRMPHPGVHEDDRCRNPQCPSGTLEKRGFAKTLNGVYQQYHCKRDRGGCGAWPRGTKRINVSNTRNQA